MNKIKTKKAFSIIEVLLVLAVAGLIMLAMFIAIPAMQRSKRNTQRRDDMARIMRAVVSYQSSHNGRAPLLSDTCSKKVQCVKLDQNFVSKFIDEHVESVTETADSSEYGYIYTFGCDSSGCPKMTDPKGNIYKIVLERGFLKDTVATVSGGGSDHTIHMVGSARCSSDAGGDDFKEFITLTNDQNDIAMTLNLEGGGIYCVDNQ